MHHLGTLLLNVSILFKKGGTLKLEGMGYYWVLLMYDVFPPTLFINISNPADGGMRMNQNINFGGLT